jgi:hypothetical protein
MTQEEKDKRSWRLKEVQKEKEGNKKWEERWRRQDEERELNKKRYPEIVEFYRDDAQDMMESQKRRDKYRRSLWPPWRRQYEREDEEIFDWKVMKNAFKRLFRNLDIDSHRLADEVDEILPAIDENLQLDMKYFSDQANQWEREHRGKPDYHENPFSRLCENSRNQLKYSEELRHEKFLKNDLDLDRWTIAYMEQKAKTKLRRLKAAQKIRPVSMQLPPPPQRIPV